MTRPFRRIAYGLLVALFASFLSLVPTPSPAGAGGDDVSTYIANINALRASVGAPPLQVLPQLSSMSATWTQQMINSNTLSHDPSPVAGLSVPWTMFAENVGTGGSTSSIWSAFVASAGHYVNIVNPEYTHIGVAVSYDANGVQWTTQRFLKVTTAPAPTAPAPPPPPPEIVFLPPPPTLPPVTAPPATLPPVVTAPPVTVAPVPTTVAPPPPEVVPAPADPERVRTVLGALTPLFG